MPLVVLNGASGAGKTTIAEAIERAYGDAIEVFFMDRAGVPSPAEMVDRFGSGEAWQEAVTFDWMTRLSPLVADGHTVIFEGQTRFSFLAEAMEKAGIERATCILVDCDDDTRQRRLSVDRKQPELANADMRNWARFLRRQAVAYGHPILDTSALSLDESVAWVLGYA
jgi:adenylate kinase family enzyme